MQKLNIDFIYYTAAEALVDVDESRMHYTTYLSLQEAIKKHMLNEENLILALCDALRGGRSWEHENCNVHIPEEATQDMKIRREGPDEGAREEDFMEDFDMAL